MSMEAIINSTLIEALWGKSSEFPDQLMGLGIDITDILVTNSQNESPHDIATSLSKQEDPLLTGNLAANIKPFDMGPLSWKVMVDEGPVPYALFVILEGVSRDYPGNDFLQRGEDISQVDIEAKVQEFENWCSNLDN